MRDVRGSDRVVAAIAGLLVLACLVLALVVPVRTPLDGYRCGTWFSGITDQAISAGFYNQCQPAQSTRGILVFIALFAGLLPIFWFMRKARERKQRTQ